MTLIDTLSERQRREEWTDEELAQRLGISRPYLVLIRSGKKPLSLNVLRSITTTFPEYEPDVLSFLRSNVTNSDITPIEEEPSHAA